MKEPIRTLSTSDEELVFFPAGSETLFGVFSKAPSDRPSLGVIALGGGGTTPTATERNRFFVTLCRRLGALGYSTLRFDYHGLGDSTGSGEFRLDRPYLEDLKAARDWMEGQGASSFVLIGSCFGARTALSGGPNLPGIRALVLLAPPVRDYGLSEPRTAGWGLKDYVQAALRPRILLGNERRITPRRYLRFVGVGLRVLFRRVKHRLSGGDETRSWVSRRFVNPLADLAGRHLPMLILYGNRDEEYRDFERARTGRLGTLLAQWPTVQIRTLEGQVHAFTRVESQQPTIDTIVDWIAETVPPSP